MKLLFHSDKRKIEHIFQFGILFIENGERIARRWTPDA